MLALHRLLARRAAPACLRSTIFRPPSMRATIIPAMIACPNCKRRVFTPRDMMYATIDGEAPCRICGRHARLDVFSRLLIYCVLAVTLPLVFMFSGIFYSVHFFLALLFIVLGGYRILSSLGLPFLALEAARGPSIDRRQSVLLLIALLAAAMTLDVFMSSRFDVGGAACARSLCVAEEAARKAADERKRLEE